MGRSKTMDPDNKKPGKQMRSDRHKAIAMTRAFDKLSDEFIENFNQTGKDGGPETTAKPSPVREALAAREKREAEAQKKAEEKPEFRGFAALMGGTETRKKTGAFARLFREEDDAPAPAQHETPAQQAAPAQPNAAVQPEQAGSETTAEGGVIKRKDTVGKKRGLYTSCMQKPTAEQWQEAAVKYARNGDAGAATNAQTEAPAETAPTESYYQQPQHAQSSDTAAQQYTHPVDQRTPLSTDEFSASPPFARPSADEVSAELPANTSNPPRFSREALDHELNEQRSSGKTIRHAAPPIHENIRASRPDVQRPHVDRSRMTYDAESPMSSLMGRIGDFFKSIAGRFTGKRDE